VSLAVNLLPVLNSARTLVADLGLRRYTVTRRLRTWSGGMVGMGQPTDVDLVLTPNPKVREIDENTVKVSHITPSNGTIGYTLDQLRPLSAPEPANQEFFYILNGPNGEIRYALVGVDSGDGPAAGDGTGSLRYTLTLQSLDRAGPK